MNISADTSHDVFISYSHKDEALAKALYALLKDKHGLQVWIDDRLDSEAAGKPFSKKIKQALDQSRRVLVLWSHHSASSVWVEDEAARAQGAQKYVPLLIDDVPTSKLPMPFSRYHTLTIGDLNKDIGKILDALGARQTPGGKHVPTAQPNIMFPKFPTSGDAFEGRRDEMAALFDVWNEGKGNIMVLDAAGGTGKTAIVNRFRNEMATSGWLGADKVLGWSFDSQGTDDKRQGSADDFFDFALEFFGNDNDNLNSPWKKGLQLAKLIQKQRALLILDGIEPLQYPAGNQQTSGRLRDEALHTLLDNLSRDNRGLVVITSRLPISDLPHDKRLVRTIALQPLPLADAVTLLRFLRVGGETDELRALAIEFGVQVMDDKGQPTGEIGGHALTLSLLAPYIANHYDGQIPTLPEIRRVFKDEGDASPAWRVMRRYEILFEVFVDEQKKIQKKAADRITGHRQLSLLRILGLFERPAEWAAIEAVLAGESIAGLTDRLDRVTTGEWKAAIIALQELGLVNKGGERDAHGVVLSLKERKLDAHPLVREYFGPRLRETNEAAYIEANRRLFTHYRWLDVPQDLQALTEKVPMHVLAMLVVFFDREENRSRQPETMAQLVRENPDWATQLFPGQPVEPIADLVQNVPRIALTPLFPAKTEDMAALFAAISHGCAAGLYDKAFNEVYQPCIKRGNAVFINKQLGAYGADLAALAQFFQTPWHEVAKTIPEHDKGSVYANTAFSLRALGRLSEAITSAKAGLQLRNEAKDWDNAAINAGNLSEMHLALGQVDKAMKSAADAVSYADRSEDPFERMAQRTAHADALHQAGRLEESESLFRAAEKMQAEHQPTMPRLYSLQGFQYCDLLLSLDRAQEVRERAATTLNLSTNQGSLLDIALDTLSLGRAALALGELDEARLRLGDEHTGALALLRDAATLNHLPRGLLALAAFHRQARETNLAQTHLNEAYAIAFRSGMRLVLADCHLEWTRLALSVGGEKNQLTARSCLKRASTLIQQTGYNRRLPDLAKLQQSLNKVQG